MGRATSISRPYDKTYGGLMNSTRIVRARRLLCIAILGAGLPLLAISAHAAPPQFNQNSAFLGQWCAQGDRNKPASISASGFSLTVTNEQGSSSIANYRGTDQNTIVAPQWQFVTGTLSSDGSRINWSNGTFWARCNSGGGRWRWWRLSRPAAQSAGHLVPEWQSQSGLLDQSEQQEPHLY